jgi:hypothetical protein
MRYSDTHKTETHAKPVKLAGRMLRTLQRVANVRKFRFDRDYYVKGYL